MGPILHLNASSSLKYHVNVSDYAVKTIHYKKKSNMLISLEITLSELAKAIEINNETNIENSSSTFH